MASWRVCNSRASRPVKTGMRTEAATLRLAVLPRAGVVMDAMLVAAGAGLIAGSAQISISLPFTPVPITGQTFSVLLVGASLGAARGGASAVVYVLLGIAGAPIYASGDHGWAVITGASGGYLVSYPFVCLATPSSCTSRRRSCHQHGGSSSEPGLSDCGFQDAPLLLTV